MIMMINGRCSTLFCSIKITAIRPPGHHFARQTPMTYRDQGRASDSDTLILLQRYRIDDAAYASVLLPGGQKDVFVNKGDAQNAWWLCDLLRQRVMRQSYKSWWDRHPNCSMYQGDVGCMLLQPITIVGFNNDQPYDDLPEFVVDYMQDGVVAAWGQDKQRHTLYTLINAGIDGASGKVRCPCLSDNETLLIDALLIRVPAGQPSGLAIVRNASHHASVRRRRSWLRRRCTRRGVFAYKDNQTGLA